MLLKFNCHANCSWEKSEFEDSYPDSILCTKWKLFAQWNPTEWETDDKKDQLEIETSKVGGVFAACGFSASHIWKNISIILNEFISLEVPPHGNLEYLKSCPLCHQFLSAHAHKHLVAASCAQIPTKYDAGKGTEASTLAFSVFYGMELVKSYCENMLVKIPVLKEICNNLQAILSTVTAPYQGSSSPPNYLFWDNSSGFNILASPPTLMPIASEISATAAHEIHDLHSLEQSFISEWHKFSKNLLFSTSGILARKILIPTWISMTQNSLLHPNLL